jgi:hypothetical protein
MTRLQLSSAIGLVLAALVGLGVRWLWRQRRSPPATPFRKVLMAIVSLACLLLLVLIGEGLLVLWHERPDQPVTADDLRILERADALLKDEPAWNRNDDKHCEDDRAKEQWSLFCALETASVEVLGEYEHTRVALQEVRFAVEEASAGRQFEGRLMGFNNLPETGFADVKLVLRTARERVAARLKRPPT